MTYSLEGFVGLIDSPVICVIDGATTRYENGKELMEQSFDKYYLVSSIKNSNEGIIVFLKEKENAGSMNWIGEEQVILP